MLRTMSLLAAGSLAVFAAAALPSTAQADDDWEDYWEDRREALEDYYEDLEERREDYYEDLERRRRRFYRRHPRPPIVGRPYVRPYGRRFHFRFGYGSPYYYRGYGRPGFGLRFGW